MARALSLDLRTRVVAAVDSGASHRTAAKRFGVSAASVSRWRSLLRRQGDPRPGPLGGNRRSRKIEAHAEEILEALEAQPDITIQELPHELARMGLTFGYGVSNMVRMTDLLIRGRCMTRFVISAPYACPNFHWREQSS